MAKTDKELTVELVSALLGLAVRRAKDEHMRLELGEETVGRMLREVYGVIHDLPGEPESKRRWL